MLSQIFNRHQKVAFQFSGGKDSTAALLLLRHYWPKMSVYWLDSGDSFPETKLVIDAVVDMGIENFVRIPGLVNEVISQYGPPSDIVPFGASEVSHTMLVDTHPMIQERALCCLRSKMMPMHQRMLDDGVTLIVRGQKSCDKFKGPFKSGDVVDGFEFFYPVEDWTDEQIFAYLNEACPEAASLYTSLDKSGDCMRCSAWLGDQRGMYLKKHHPQSFTDYKNRLRLIANACAPAVGALFSTIAEVCPVD